MNARLKNADGELVVRIDDQDIPIGIKEIVKESTEIIALRSFNTPLYENVEIEALVCLQRIENFEDVLEDVIPIEKGIVTISIYDENQDYLYETETISFTDGEIKYRSRNKYQLGDYVAVIEYDGNKYFSPSSFIGNFSVEKRHISLFFDDLDYSAYPTEVLNIGLGLFDEITMKPLSVNVEYEFNGDIFTTFTNEKGMTNLVIVLPDVNQEFCGSNDDTERGETSIWAYFNEDTEIWDYIDEEDVGQGESNEFFYEVLINVISDTYEMETTSLRISSDKIPTQINAFNMSVEEYNDYIFIEGDVLAILPNGETNVQYGKVAMSFDGLDAETVVDVNADGHFSIEMPVSDIQVASSNDIEEYVVYEDTIVPKETRIRQEINKRTFNRGEELKVTATCTYVDNLAEPLPLTEGMVIFTIKNKDTKEEIYRYGSELDESGEAVMYFNVSKQGSFDIITNYHGIFEFKSLTKLGLEYQVL